MNASAEIIDRVRRSYELMLDFYGMRLLDAETGLVGRKEHGWKPRYQNLTRSPHNNLRITRIIKFMSIMSYPQYAAPFVLHVLSEQSEHGLLNTSMLQGSLDRWWANCNRDAGERDVVQDIVKRVRTASNASSEEDRWVFTRDIYETMITARAEGKGLALPPEA
ncbi:opioid growth factor receptor [Ceratobasidium sp. AG-Ba]|nr:opioid growth factor receptor [Ceratobasidium sp. AG-Ba]